MPFKGDYSGTAWNAQTLFASSIQAQHPKQQYAWKLLGGCDFLGVNETHGTEGRVLAATLPSSCRCFWSHASSRRSAGIGLLVQNSFLPNFNPIQEGDWEELETGRVGRLKLRGAQAALELYIVYLAAGNPAADAARRRSIDMIARRMAPSPEVLSLIFGDFNFVEHHNDRWCTTSSTWSGG
jgi:exonuclease III